MAKSIIIGFSDLYYTFATSTYLNVEYDVNLSLFSFLSHWCA